MNRGPGDFVLLRLLTVLLLWADGNFGDYPKFYCMISNHCNTFLHFSEACPMAFYRASWNIRKNYNNRYLIKSRKVYFQSQNVAWWNCREMSSAKTAKIWNYHCSECVVLTIVCKRNKRLCFHLSVRQLLLSYLFFFQCLKKAVRHLMQSFMRTRFYSTCQSPMTVCRALNRQSNMQRCKILLSFQVSMADHWGLLCTTCLTRKQMGIFIQNVILLSNIDPCKSNISVWIWSNTMYV